MKPLRDLIAIVWLLALIVVVIFYDLINASDWLVVHLVFLGAMTHSALVWSEYFANTLLKTRSTPEESKRQNVRIIVLAAGSALVFVGYPADRWIVVGIGATLVAAAVLWHGGYLVGKVRRALPGRFRIVTKYYVAAALMLPVGATFGVILAYGPSDEWRGRLMIAHMTFNLLGWLGLTVVGTLLTFWPTMVRARMDARAEELAIQALWPLIIGIFVLASGALAGLTWLALVGLAIYAAGLIWWGRALWAPVALKGIREFAPASVGAAMVWAAVGLVWVGAILATSATWPEVTDRLVDIAPLLAFGFALQLLLGALSYLLPVLMGKSPRNVVVYQDGLNTWATFRIAAPNLALAFWLLPLPDGISRVVAIFGLGVALTFIPIMLVSIRRGLAHRRSQESKEAHV